MRRGELLQALLAGIQMPGTLRQTAEPGRPLRRHPRDPAPGNTLDVAQLRWQKPANGSVTSAMAQILSCPTEDGCGELCTLPNWLAWTPGSS